MAILLFLLIIVFIHINPLFLIIFLVFFLLKMVIVLGFVLNSFFYSYLIFILFIRGLIVIFIYICRLVINEKMSLKNFLLVLIALFFIYFINFDFGRLELFSILKFYFYTLNGVSLVIVFFLFLILFVVYEILKKAKFPLRIKL